MLQILMSCDVMQRLCR